ncbi:TPA: DNA-packaging protein [Enterococcus faecalis]|nr:DNA-packaging protein [Enterococcus faecalis]
MIPKFRAWDKKYKKMMKVNQIDFEKKTVWLEADNGDHENRHTLTREFKDVILMQSTGLKDKNGVEIFEGDIGWDDHQEVHGQVIFENGAFKYEWENISEDLFEATNDIEIVGNIHENPELLEGN